MFADAKKLYGWKMISVIPSDRVARNLLNKAFNSGCENLEDLREIMLESTWMPMLFSSEYRLTENFESASVIALDLDNGLVDLDTAIELCKDFRHIIGTTKSHGKPKNGKPACDRYRLVLATNGSCHSVATYQNTYRHFAKMFHADGTHDAARLMHPCVEIVSERLWQGLEVSWIPAPKIKPKKRSTKKFDIGNIPEYVRSYLDCKQLKDDQHHKTFYWIVCHLMRNLDDETAVREIMQRSRLGEYVLNASKGNENEWRRQFTNAVNAVNK